MSQTAFSFPGNTSPATSAALWIIACPDNNAAEISSYLKERRHLFIDSESGRVAIRPSDYILIPRGGTGEFSCFLPINNNFLRAASLESLFSTLPTVSSEITVVQNLIGIFLGVPGLCTAAPPRRATDLERLFYALRHPSFASSHRARFDRAQEAQRDLRSTWDDTLVGLISREAADAARLISTDHYDPLSRERTFKVNRDALFNLEAGGLSTYGDALRRAINVQHEVEQLEFDFIEQKDTRATPYAKRPSYRFARILGHRFNLNFDRSKTSTSLTPARQVREFDMSVRDLVNWLQGLASPTLRPWFRWENSTDAAPYVLRAGVDADFAILLGIAGQTGKKAGKYKLRVWGDGCAVDPLVAVSDVGSACEIVVRPSTLRRARLQLEFTTTSGSRMVESVFVTKNTMGAAKAASRRPV